MPEVDIYSLEHRLKVIEAAQTLERFIKQRLRLPKDERDFLVDTAMQSSSLVSERDDNPDDIRANLRRLRTIGPIVLKVVYGLGNGSIAEVLGSKASKISTRISDAAADEVWLSEILDRNGSDEEKERRERQFFVQRHQLRELTDLEDNKIAFTTLTSRQEARQALRSVPFAFQRQMLNYFALSQYDLEDKDLQSIEMVNQTWNATTTGYELLRHRTVSPLVPFYGISTEDFAQTRDRIADRLLQEEGAKVWLARIPETQANLFRTYINGHAEDVAEDPGLYEAFSLLDDQRRGLLLPVDWELSEQESAAARRILTSFDDDSVPLSRSERFVLTGRVAGLSSTMLAAMQRQDVAWVDERVQKLLDRSD